MENPDKNESAEEINIQDSTLNKVQIGQASGDLNQAARDIINNVTTFMLFNSDTNGWSEEKLDELSRLKESLENEFQEKLKDITNVVIELRAQVEDKLSTKSQKDEATIFNLLDRLQSLVGYEGEINSIHKDLEIHKRAALWLHSNAAIIAHKVTNTIFSKRTLPELRESYSGKRDLLSGEITKHFRSDLQLSLAWICAYIDSGTYPREFDKSLSGEFYLELKTQIYKEAFNIITHDLLDPDVSGLTVDEAEVIASYINRFLIRKELMAWF